jgi:hypothetical protein
MTPALQAFLLKLVEEEWQLELLAPDPAADEFFANPVPVY